MVWEFEEFSKQCFCDGLNNRIDAKHPQRTFSAALAHDLCVIAAPASTKVVQIRAYA